MDKHLNAKVITQSTVQKRCFMLELTSKETMSHREIAELVKSRDDSVKRTIERLSKNGVITFTPMVENSTGGRPSTDYHVNERDSYIVVAQLSPEFTAFLVDEWQKRKRQQPEQPQWLLSLSPEAKIAISDLAKQRDEAIKTKAQINDKRTATLMNKASQDAKKIKKLESQLQHVGEYISLLAAKLPQRIDTEFKSNVQTWRVLKQISESLGYEIIKAKDERYRRS